jgi:enamine deaminase RidA (YjgF/YER057c/UK114 family)
LEFVDQEDAMEMQSRRGMLTNVWKVAVAAAGGAVVAGKAEAQAGSAARKRNATAKPGTPAPATPLPFTAVVGYGNLLFVAGIGCRVPGTIEEATKWVLDEIEKNLAAAGSSLDKVLKVDVCMLDMKEFDRMNAVYKTRKWGSVFPARNTFQVAALPAGDYHLAIACVAGV